MISPSNDDTIVNWNNKQAPGWQAADDEWSLRLGVRNELLEAAANGPQHPHARVQRRGDELRGDAGPAQRRRPSAGSSAMLKTGRAPSARAQQMYQLLLDWRAQGSSRLDADLNGDHRRPGCGDHGPRVDQVRGRGDGPGARTAARRPGVADEPGQQGQQPGVLVRIGWYGYVDKDLRTLRAPGPRRRQVQDEVLRGGQLPDLQDRALGGAEAAGTELEDEFANPDPNVWRSDASTERIASRRASCPSRCAGPTGPRSSRPSRTTPTGRRREQVRRARHGAPLARAAPRSLRQPAGYCAGDVAGEHHGWALHRTADSGALAGADAPDNDIRLAPAEGLAAAAIALGTHRASRLRGLER